MTRSARDLDRILDARAGVDPTEPDRIPPGTDSLPLSAGFVDRTARAAAAAAEQAPHRRRAWPLAAALIPTLLLVSATCHWLWDPRDSATLSYEGAHTAAVDPSYTAENRNTALGRLMRPLPR